MNYRSILFTTAIATMGAFSFGHSPVSAHSLPANSPLLTASISETPQPKVSQSFSAASAAPADFNQLETVLNQHLGQPFAWGATGPTAFDCSGLTQFAFRQALGLNLNRTAEQQFQQAQRIDATAVRPGDLVFFSYNHGQTIDHVGIVVNGNHLMIVAQNRGVIRESYATPWWQPFIAGYGRVLTNQ